MRKVGNTINKIAKFEFDKVNILTKYKLFNSVTIISNSGDTKVYSYFFTYCEDTNGIDKMRETSTVKFTKNVNLY